MSRSRDPRTMGREASRRPVGGPDRPFGSQRRTPLDSAAMSREVVRGTRRRERVLRSRWLLGGVVLPAVLAAGVLVSCSSAQGPEVRLEERAPGRLADHAALLRARRLRQESRLDDAIEAARAGLSHDPPSEVRAELHREMARVHLARGDLLEAYHAQERAQSSSRDPAREAEMAHELAWAFDEASLPGDALVLYRQVWTGWPREAIARSAYDRSRAIEAATGAEPPSAEVLLATADALSAAGRCEQALKLYDRALAHDGLEAPLLRRAEYARADCLFTRKRYEEAAAAYTRIVEDDPGESNVRVALARTHARSGNSSLAVKQLDAVARRADPVTRARARYLAAILVDPPESPEAQKRLRQVESQKAAPGFAQLARWRLAWADLTGGHPAAAAKRLRLLAEGDLLDIEVQRAFYWLAIAAVAQENFEEGRARLEQLVEEVPLTYYGFLAADRLELAEPSPRLVLPPARSATEPLRTPRSSGRRS